MEYEEVIALAKNCGFEKAAIISTGDLVFVHEYRKFCAQNACGNYGKNYACPPHCGTPKEMEEKVRTYKRAIVFQSRSPVKDIFDDKETKIIKKTHTLMTLNVMEQMKQHGVKMDGMPIMAGPCNYCEECHIAKDKPCVNPQMCFSCLSAYCIDAASLAKLCEMEMQWNSDVVSFFSLYLFDQKVQEE